MFNSQRPSNDELPSSRQLLRATAISLAVAGGLLVTVVLPAEYAIDPTGIGGALGFTEMGEIKEQLAREAAADDAASAPSAGAAVPAASVAATRPGSSPAAAATTTATTRSDVTRLTLEPGQGAEIKVTMAEGLRVTYDWSVSGGAVNYDTHGDAPGIDYHGFDKGRNSTGEQGQLVAPFDGKHGWFWRNRGDAAVTITLTTQGAYTEIRRVV